MLDAHAICSTIFFFRWGKKFADEKLNFAGENIFLLHKINFSLVKFDFSPAIFHFGDEKNSPSRWHRQALVRYYCLLSSLRCDLWPVKGWEKTKKSFVVVVVEKLVVEQDRKNVTRLIDLSETKKREKKRRQNSRKRKKKKKPFNLILRFLDCTRW